MSHSIRKILFPTAVVLFILEVLTLPLVLGLTYASKSESPEHILTFSEQKLFWDVNTEVDAKGTAKLSLFEDHYANVQTKDGANVIAPGTQGSSIVRLKNDDENSIRYTAVVYAVRSVQTLPVAVQLSGEHESAAAEYTLPEGISKSAVISAVTGTVGSGRVQDFGIDWTWNYEDNAQQDATDTAFGDRAAYEIPDDIIVGIYITVEDDNGDIIISSPQTGYDAVIGGYTILLCISMMMMLILTITRKKEGTNEE